MRAKIALETARLRHVAQARASIICNSCSARIEACECGWRREGQLARQVPDIVLPPAPTLVSEMAEFIAASIGGLPRSLELRGVSNTMAAALVEVDRTTLHKWSRGSVPFRGSAPRLSVVQLERLVCLLTLPSPVAPPLPESMRLRRVAGRLQLEMSGTHDRVGDLEAWVRTWPRVHNAPTLELRISRSLVRMVIEGPADVLRLMRQEILASERWRTMTPSDLDIERWLRGDVWLRGVGEGIVLLASDDVRCPGCAGALTESRTCDACDNPSTSEGSGS